jgi:plasmid replication initiation protein
LSFEDDKDGPSRRKSAPSSQDEIVQTDKPRKRRAAAPEVGHALRAAYQRTIDEDIPTEMLDLLGKLG